MLQIFFYNYAFVISKLNIYLLYIIMENDLYKIECDDINNIMSKIKDKPLNNEEVTTLNDTKYRELRKKIMFQNKEIDSLKSKIKILENIVKEN
tara:strand:+ start:378 stop:659 length:282 start_codon:yes stop_codon:yes gene_type:complete